MLARAASQARCLTHRALTASKPHRHRALTTMATGDKLRQPTVIDCVLVDHRNVISLLDSFEQVRLGDLG